MRNRLVIWLLALVLTGLTASCRKEQADRHWGEPASLNIVLYLPQPEATRAETGDVAVSPAAEGLVNTLQIWVFRHSNGAAIGYMEPATNNLQSGLRETYAMYIEDEIASAKPNVDVYVLANAEAAGLALTRNATRAQVEAAVLTGSYFGTDPLTSAVPDAGLPMAGVLKDTPMIGANVTFSVETVTLERLVSKLRFIFCTQAEESNGTLNAVDDFEITQITLDGSLIATSENVFNTTAYPYSFSGYVSGAVNYPVPSPSEVALNPRPGDYIYETQGAQEYEDLINEGLRAGRLTEWGRTYFRESDKKLTGRIKYSVRHGAVKTAEFSMDAAGDFARNHSWLIYAYFLGGELHIVPTEVPWIAGHDYYEYQTQGQTVMDSGISYLRYDIDGVDWTWYDDNGNPDTYMCVAYSPHGSRPLYSTLNPIRIQTNNEYDLVLQSNNPHFLLQEVEYTGGTISGYKTPAVSISLDAGENDIAFFIVAAAATLGGRSAYGKIFLTATPDPATGIPPFNIPYNHLLPGPEGHTAILVYDPLPPTYMDNMDNEYVQSDDPAARVHYWWVGEK